MYTVAGRAIGFALEQPLHVVALACSASGISKQLEYKQCNSHLKDTDADMGGGLR
jgi:hypothetical protein